jgi:cytidylate kinase
LVVALDGPGSSGKSSVGAAAAREIGYRFFDTGLLYRAITWLALDRQVGSHDADALVDLVEELELADDDAGHLNRVLSEGRDVTDAVRGPEVDANVSEISAVAPLRAAADARILTTDGNEFEDTVAMVVGAIRDAEARAADEASRAAAAQ